MQPRPQLWSISSVCNSFGPSRAKCSAEQYLKRHRISSRELGADVLPEPPAQRDQTNYLPPFDELVAGLPESQREVLVMLKVNGLSIEEFARTTTSTPGAVSRRPTMNGLRNVLKRAPAKPPDKKKGLH